eukprot:g61567.t1
MVGRNVAAEVKGRAGVAAEVMVARHGRKCRKCLLGDRHDGQVVVMVAGYVLAVVVVLGGYKCKFEFSICARNQTKSMV